MKQTIGYRRGDVPSYCTIWRALQAVDGVELEAKLEAWARALSGEEEAGAGVAIDGKTRWENATREHEALAVLKAWRQWLVVALGQRLVGAKTNAIPESRLRFAPSRPNPRRSRTLGNAPLVGQC